MNTHLIFYQENHCLSISVLTQRTFKPQEVQGNKLLTYQEHWQDWNRFSYQCFKHQRITIRTTKQTSSGMIWQELMILPKNLVLHCKLAQKSSQNILSNQHRRHIINCANLSESMVQHSIQSTLKVMNTWLISSSWALIRKKNPSQFQRLQHEIWRFDYVGIGKQRIGKWWSYTQYFALRRHSQHTRFWRGNIRLDNIKQIL